jgi:hypothetical protein
MMFDPFTLQTSGEQRRTELLREANTERLVAQLRPLGAPQPRQAVIRLGRLGAVVCTIEFLHPAAGYDCSALGT